MIVFLCLIVLFFQPVFASDYGVYSPDNYSVKSDESERLLFILDFSNSMNEYSNGERKVDLMLDTMKKLLPTLNPKVPVGLRVYGHKMGFSAYDACHASSLVVPVGENRNNIRFVLSDLHPRGMTPITYSLKQAVKKDFLGFKGRKHIILLTDGGENCAESPCQYVMELIKIRKDIYIDVIAFNVEDKDDLEQLECTALVTSGKFYTASTAAELAESLKNSVSAHKEVDAKILTNY